MQIVIYVLMRLNAVCVSDVCPVLIDILDRYLVGIYVIVYDSVVKNV